ncbi:(E3-independent) E2 ubiquitin-conjugating enzyme UBE2O [Liparis tanakae]|uniref:(E3-independent) E2 ubiquitin-conjugating enzyme n=1 Tax=Liparis tanakae TaxID=230148 RepID=A0A4Z2HV07_9TELE|nr:(E3-independent) E2 ubiquitin-conjugating enzyme UBE2O [Liparis tanakae]
MAPVFSHQKLRSDNQCGIVTNIDIECAVKLVGTNCVLYPVNSKDLQHIWSFMYGDYIAYDFWLGKVYDLTNHIILKLSNGARCSMSVEDGAKLYDVCPHVSDSGLFFDEAYGFYPGQVLIGPAKVFSNVQWLSGVKPVLSRKCKFRVVVEEVKVVELKVTWITKSYSPKGSDSVYPPASSIPQEHLCRVRRLGYYDHTQRQLGERALYVFHAKGDATRITWEHRSEPTDSSHPNNNNGSVAPVQNPPDSQNAIDPSAEHGEQDADDEAAEDTDDTSSLTSSASSTASSQSGGLGLQRKKSVPLSIRNLKRKHKKKRTKFSREFKPGDRVAVEVVSTKTTADVMWKDGRVETGIRSNDLIPIQHLDSHEFCPGDFVVDKRPQALQDPGVYGVIQSGDHKGRTCIVKWIKLNATSDDVEVFGMEEDVSVYDIADHPDFHFRTTDIVIRIWNSENERHDCENEHLYNVESEIEETDYDSVEETSSVLSTEEWEDESDSWETDNGLTTEDDGGANNADAVETSTPTPTPTSAAVGQQSRGTTPGAVNGAEKPSKDGASRGFKELKEALKILESLKNMTVEQLWTGGSPTSPTSVEPASAASAATSAAPTAPEKPTREKRFLDDIKKLQENLRKTLDNVAIVEEEKMEAVVEAGGSGGAGPEVERAGEEKPQQEPLTPLGAPEWPSEVLSDTPVLLQQSGGKPGVTFTSAKGEKMEFQPAEAKKFFSTVRKEMALLATSLPDGIMVKTFEDRMDLFSSLIKGPTRTPYEDGLFLFDIQLPNIYPSVPPLFRYLSQCSGRLNPNLYDNGKVCVSLLGTWIGKGNERWTSKSSLLQVLISIQGLILVNEPYYNEAGFDSDRGLQEGYENSRCYNEMALIKMVQSMTLLLQHPVEVFKQEIQEHFASNGWRLVHRLEAWLELNDGAERAQASHAASRARPSKAEPLDEQGPAAAAAHGGPGKLPGEEGVTGVTGVTSIMEEELEDSGLSPSTTAASQPEPSHNSACDGVQGSGVPAGENRAASKVVVSGGSQPAVRPKKRRKSYRSFLPEGSGYPDIGFPLFPLSKGFVKSIRGVLLQYRAALAAAAIPQHAEDNVSSDECDG